MQEYSKSEVVSLRTRTGEQTVQSRSNYDDGCTAVLVPYLQVVVPVLLVITPPTSCHSHGQSFTDSSFSLFQLYEQKMTGTSFNPRLCCNSFCLYVQWEWAE